MASLANNHTLDYLHDGMTTTARALDAHGLLHAGTIRAPLPPGWSCDWDGRTPLALPNGDCIAPVGTDGFGEPLRVHARRGGERIRLPGRTHSHALKQVLQEHAVPPWRRDRLPLLSRGDTVLAAGDAILSGEFAAWLQARGARLHWTPLA